MSSILEPADQSHRGEEGERENVTGKKKREKERESEGAEDTNTK